LKSAWEVKHRFPFNLALISDATRGKIKRLPFACTTNFADRLDRATLRRFLLRVNFDFLAPAQAALLFERSFYMTSPSSLSRRDPLIPADFSRVVRRGVIFGLKAGAEEMLSQLAAEIESEEGAPCAIQFSCWIVASKNAVEGYNDALWSKYGVDRE
jgi:hypothetical protein